MTKYKHVLKSINNPVQKHEICRSNFFKPKYIIKFHSLHFLTTIFLFQSMVWYKKSYYFLGIINLILRNLLFVSES